MELDVAVEILLPQIQVMLAESGNMIDFNTVLWLANWLESPVPALANACPITLMDTPEGVAQVQQILAQMKSGAYA